MPSHRALALFRGRNEGFLRLQLALDSDPTDGSPRPQPLRGRIAGRFGIRDQGRLADAWLRETVRWAWSVKISLHLELWTPRQLREKAEEEAIRVFGRNLKDLLLAAPAGPRATLGLDPGLRTGVKVPVVDQTGKLLDTGVIYPHEPTPRLGRQPAHAVALARSTASAHRHRQRHRQPRNRQARRRSHQTAPRSWA